ncbi:MAG: hypothetical protein JWO05_3185 [Gemmatimonadetes bacterium]|nr:hypothetical protein [Gemmatimonadota bacterium]
MKRGRWLLAALLLLVLLGTAGALVRKRMQAPVAAGGVVVATPDASAPSGVRIKVEVLNATRVRGLARRATMLLRDRGFDVVAVATAQPQQDETVVIDRSNHPEWAQRVAKALGSARVESRADGSRYLDVTVLVGRTWRPPAEPFYP